MNAQLGKLMGYRVDMPELSIADRGDLPSVQAWWATMVLSRGHIKRKAITTRLKILVIKMNKRGCI